jgi:hypothetical protein
MNEATQELLSRYLDGDLPTDEARRLERRLESEPELRDELASMTSLRQAVRTLASHEQPPEELETLVEPLRRSAPVAHGVRPAFRWLAAAATVVVAVGVAVQVAKLNPTPTLPSPPAAPRSESASPDRGYYELKPLPTRPQGEGDELLGAADRLLASPLPVPEIEAARPMEVVGPLQEAPRAGRSAEVAAADEPVPAGRQGAPVEGGEAEALRSQERRALAEAEWAPAPTEEVARPQVEPGSAQGIGRSRTTASLGAEAAPQAKAARRPVTARLLMRIEDELHVVAQVASPELEAGTYHLQLTVQQGQITACRGGEGLEDRLAREACASLLRVVLDGVHGGQHSAQLVVPGE